MAKSYGDNVVIHRGGTLVSFPRPANWDDNYTKQEKKKKEEHKKENKQDYDYELYKKAKDNPDSIDPMTENSTDWEALEKKYKDKYLKEKIGNDSEKLHKYADEEGILPSQLQDRLGIKDSDLGLKDEYTKQFEEEMQGMERYLKAEEAKKSTNENNKHVVKVMSNSGRTIKTEKFDKEEDADKFINSIDTNRYNYKYSTEEHNNYKKPNQDDIDNSYFNTAKRDKARENALSGIPNANNKVYSKERLESIKNALNDGSLTQEQENNALKDFRKISGGKRPDEIYNIEDGKYTTKKETTKNFERGSKEHFVPDTRILNREKMVEGTNKSYKDNKPIIDSQKSTNETMNNAIRNKANEKKALNNAWLKYKEEHPGTTMTKNQFEKDIYKK